MINEEIKLFKENVIHEIPVKDENQNVISNLFLVNDGFLLQYPEIIEYLHNWREKNKQWYLTEFQYDIENTRKWIKEELISNQSRLFFFIGQDKENLVGHIGLRDITELDAEFDNPMKGEVTGCKGLMTYAGIQLANTAFKALRLETLYVQIFDNNYRSIQFHERIGFQPLSKSYLNKIIGSDGLRKYVVCDEEDSNVDFTYNKYYLSKERFYSVNDYL